MTMPMDPFQPGTEDAQASAGASPQSAAQEWTTALQDPRVKRSLLSFGLQMLQPPQFGQTIGGQIAQGIGAAGESQTAADEEDRKAAEQARKERDTSSNIDYRADTTDVKLGQLENQRLRTEQAGKDLESRAALRESQVQVNVAKAGELGARVEMLQARVALFPQDQQAKMDLARAKQALLEAQTRVQTERADVIAPTAAARIKRDESATNLNTTRAGSVESNADVARRRVQAQEDRTQAQGGWQATRAENQRRRDYGNYVKEEEKAKFLDRKRPPALGYQEWLKTFEPKQPGATQPPAQAGTTTPAPTQPTQDSQVPDASPDPSKRNKGSRYMTPRGPMTWTGTGWLP